MAKKKKVPSRRKPILQLDDKGKGSQSSAVDPYRQTSVQSAIASPVQPTQKSEQAQASADDVELYSTMVGDDESVDAAVGNERTSNTEENAIDTKLQDFLQQINELGTNGPTASGDVEVLGTKEQQEEISEDVQKKVDILKVGAYSSDPESMEEGGRTEDGKPQADGEEITFWQQVVDPNTNHAYYWNPQTNEVSWTLPDNGVIATDQDNTGQEEENQYADSYAYYSQAYNDNNKKDSKTDSKSERKSKRSAAKKSTTEKSDLDKELPEAIMNPGEEGFVGPTLLPASSNQNSESNPLEEQARDTVQSVSVNNESPNKSGLKRKAPPDEHVSPDVEPVHHSVAKKPRLKTKVTGSSNNPLDTSPQSKQAELVLRLQVSNMADELSRKLHYLHVTNEGLSELQILNIQIQTRLSDWKEGGLTSKFMLSKLQGNAISLEKYEQTAAPEGWKVIWDSSSCRYQYHNLSTGESTWQYPVQYTAESQSSELSSQEDSSDIEATGDDEVPHLPLASVTEHSLPEPRPPAGSPTVVKSTPESTTQPTSLAQVLNKMEVEPLQVTDKTKPSPGQMSVTESKPPQYHGPTAEYLMNQEGPPIYWKNKSRSTDVPPPPPPSSMKASTEMVRRKLTPGGVRQPRLVTPEQPTLSPYQIEGEDKTTAGDTGIDDLSSFSENQESMEFISEFPPRPKKKPVRKANDLKVKADTKIPEESKKEIEVSDDSEARLRERLLERQKHRIKLDTEEAISENNLETTPTSLQPMEATVIGAAPSLLVTDRVEQSTGEHEQDLSDNQTPTVEHLARGDLDDSRVEPETGEVETIQSDSNAERPNSIPHYPILALEITDTDIVKIKIETTTGDDGVEEGEIVTGSPQSSGSGKDDNKQLKTVPLGRCYMDMEDDRRESRKSADKDDRYTGSDASDYYSGRQHSPTKPYQSPSPSSSKDSSYHKSSSRKSDRRHHSRHHDSDSDRDRERYYSDDGDDRGSSRRRHRSSKRHHSHHNKDYVRSSDESDDYHYSEKDNRHSHRSSRSSRHYHRDDRGRSYSDDDRYDRDKSYSSKKSHRRHRSRSHSKDSQTSSRRHRQSRSHSRDSHSSYQSDRYVDKDKKSPSSKRKKEKREKKDKKKRRKSDKEKPKEEDSDPKPPPHVIVGKVGRIASKRTLGKDRKLSDGGTASVSENDKLEMSSTAASTVTIQPALPLAMNTYPSVYPTASSSVYSTAPQYMSATFYQQPSTGQVPYYPMGSYGDYQTMYDQNLYQQNQGAIHSGDIGQQQTSGETTHETIGQSVEEPPAVNEPGMPAIIVPETAAVDEPDMPSITEEPLSRGAVDDAPIKMELEKNESEDQITECEMEIEDNSPDVTQQFMEQDNDKADTMTTVEPTSTSDIIDQPTADRVQSLNTQDDNKEPLPPGCELEVTPNSIIESVNAAPLSETVESEKKSVVLLDQQETPTQDTKPPLPLSEPKSDGHTLPPEESDKDDVPPPPGTESLPEKDNPLSSNATAIDVSHTESNTQPVPPDSELETNEPKSESEALQSIATQSTDTTNESISAVSAVATSSYSYTPDAQAPATYYQTGTSTVSSGTYDYTAYAQSLAAQQQQAYNYAYATNNYSGYMQAYNAYLQQASAAASYGAYGGQYYPNTYAYPGASQYSAGATYYGTDTGSYSTGSYQSLSQQMQAQAAAQQQQAQVQAPATTTGSAGDSESVDSNAQGKKSEFALAGSKQKQMKTMIDKWSNLKDSSQS